MPLGFEDARASMPNATYGLFEYLATKKDLSRWVLVGGTALSLYLKHRTSEDLDFFIEESEFTRGNLKEIDELVKHFEKSGVPTVLTDTNDRQFDYMIGGVKVTFFASGLKSLKEGMQKIGSINIASVEQIAAMKMESIIKYRTLTRDFFDVHTLWQQCGMDLYALIDNYRDKYSPKVSVGLFEARFFDKEMDINDPGYGSLQVKQKFSPADIRQA
ncbi:MAG: nucleotidyl transferase AbiEii/AbiGii toxin family protein, partial [Sulfuricurvum sp.]|nr:nucleotidyl transferase AbiEii/AbiGii toxin family protein [Sulfuricurvum sp.]